MNLRELLKKQEELDKMIFKRAGVKDYPYKNAKLALLVELGELANEVQCFKYWKQHKEIDREKVLEEFADCLHFALSIENHLEQIDKRVVENLDKIIEKLDENKELDKEINTAFLIAYENTTLGDNVLLSIVDLGRCLNITIDEMEQAYLKKYEKNIRRQQDGY